MRTLAAQYMVSAMTGWRFRRSLTSTRMRSEHMQRAPIDGIELEYETCGTGEPVVLIHAGVCADFFRPLIEQRALTNRYTVLRYHRTG
jgi:hypothetical protein